MSGSGQNRHRSVMIALFSGVVAVAFESIAVATAMPAAAAQLGQIGLYAWAFSLFVMGMMVATVVAGRMSDRRGPVLPLMIGMVAFLTGLVAAALSVNMPMLLVARAVQGVGGGFLNLSIMVLVAHLFTAEQRPRVMTGFSVCWLLPAFVGPAVAAWITTRWSWHWVFIAVIPLLAAALVLGFRPVWALRDRVSPAGRSESSGSPIWAAVVTACGLVAVQAAGQSLSGAGLGGSRTIVAAGAAGLGLAAITVAVPRLMPAGFVTWQPGLGALMWARGLQAGAFGAAEAFLPLSLVTGRGMSLGLAGGMLTIGASGWMLGSWLQSRPWVASRRDYLLRVGTAIGALGVALIAVAAFWVQLPVALEVVGWVFAGTGMGLAVATASLSVMSLSAGHELGRNTSALQVSDSLGVALAVGLAGTTFALLHDRATTEVTFGAVFLTALVVGVAAIAAARRVGPVFGASDSATTP